MTRDWLWIIRGFRRRPLQTAAMVASLALGIGANSAIVDLVDRLLLSPPPHVEAPTDVVRVLTSRPTATGEHRLSEVVSYPAYDDIARSTKTLATVGAYAVASVDLGRGRDARSATATLATASFLQLTGVRPAYGRLYQPDEDAWQAGDAPVVISDAYWRGAYNADPTVLGRQLLISARPHTIVGVMPPGFSGTESKEPDFWLPLRSTADRFLGADWATNRASAVVHVVGRLADDATRTQAAAEVSSIVRSSPAYSESVSSGAARELPGPAATVVPIASLGNSGRSLLVKAATLLAALSLLVVLVACLNVAGVLVANGVERGPEIAVRMALGMPRSHAIRMFLVEALLLALLGGAVGAGVAFVASKVVREVFLTNVALADRPPRAAVLGVLVAVTVLAGLVSGALAASRLAKVDFAAALKAHASAGTPSTQRRRRALAAVQVGLAGALLVFLNVFLTSFSSLRHERLGTEPDSVIVASVNLQRAGFDVVEAQRILGQSLDRVASIPGIRHAALATAVPLRDSYATYVSVPGVDSIPRLASGGPYLVGVTDAYFDAVGATLRRGRRFTQADGAAGERVVIVNATMARAVWGTEDVIDRCLVAGRDPTCRRVVGVVDDIAREVLFEGETLQFYVPLSQAPATLPPLALFFRSDRETAAVGAVVRRAMYEVEPAMPYVDVQRFTDLMDPQLHAWRIATTVLSAFGTLGLIIAAIGTYSIAAFQVAVRRRELGIRLALGAPRRHVVSAALRHGAVDAIIAAATGAAAAVILVQQVTPWALGATTIRIDHVAAAIGVLVTVVLTSQLLGARRLLSLRPLEALRGQGS